MTQGPWSVKGIDPKARSLARERAQRRGVTLGEYLNTLLLDDEGAGRISDVDVGFEPREFSREGAPDDLRRMSGEIDLLTQRLEATQSRSARAMAGIDKSILGLMGKVEVSGKAQLTALERVTRALSEIDTTQAALRARIDGLESDDRGGATMLALKSLEGSLSRLSEAVQERVGALEANQESFRDLFDERVTRVSDRMDGFARGLDDALNQAVRTSSNGLAGRVDQIENQMTSVERRMEGALGRITDAAQRFELFEAKADRTVSDTTWRMERALESNMSRSRALSKDLLDRVDSIEEKTREAVGALGDAVTRITDRLTRAERKQDTVASVLERSVSEIDDRVARIGSGGGGDVAAMQAVFQKRLETLAEDLSRPIHAVRLDVERRVEEALRAGAQPERMDRLEQSLRQVQDELQRSEARQADLVRSMTAQADRLSRTVDERLASVESRDDGRTIATVRKEMMALADTIEARLAAAELQSRSTTGAVESLRGDVAKLDQSVTSRLADSEHRTAQLFDEMGGQVATVAERLQRRHEESIQRLNSRIEEQQAAGLNAEDIDRLADRLDERVRDSERRSAEAIGQIGEQVARVADRLQTQHQESLRTLEARLSESDRTHEARLSEVLADMSRRMDEIGEESAASLAPVHNTVSSIARRMAEIEDVALAKADPVLFASEIAQDDAPTPAGHNADDEDDLILRDDAPEQVAPQQASDDESPASDLFDEGQDLVGVDPPPFDRGDGNLFDEKLEIHVGTGASLTDGAPAREIDDLLEMDDMVLAADGPREFVGDLPADDAHDRPSLDYLAEARKAARQGRRLPTDAASSGGRRGLGRGPLIASAALAVAVAGGGAWTVMRGKQDPSSDDFAKLDPSSPEAQAGDAQAAAAVLFPPDDAPAAAGETARAAEGPAADMFEPTGPVTAVQAAAAVVAPTDAPAAITLADAVADGDPVALHDYALEILQTGEKARAVSLLREAAGKGLVMAQYRLAKLYERGEGVPRDIAASRQWTEKAAIGGNSKAMHDLAVFYAEGDGGPQSYAAAVEWFRQASDLGLVDSQYNLAVLFEQGLGVTQDKAEAAYWFEVASRAGDTDATRKARALLAELPPADAEQTRRKARAFNPRQPIAHANGEFGKRAWDAPTTSQVSEAQRLLERMGYVVGSTDGRMGAKTAEAIRQFERDNDLPVTGEASVSLLGQLRAATLNSAG